MGSQKMELEEPNLYGSTKNGTRRNSFILVHKKMELEETNFFGSTKKEREETLLYGPTKRKQT